MELSPVFQTRIKHKGIFDFKEGYQFLWDFFQDYQYLVIEKKYEEKVGAFGKDLEIVWSCLKKINDYFRFNVSITWRPNSLTEVEVQEDGKKVKKNKGTFDVIIKANLERDYENRWEENVFKRFLRNLYDRYIIKSRTEFYEQKLAEEMAEAAAQLKSLLVLEGKLD
ncbi:MAG: hypothetical protein ABH817_00915 [archaeon]